MTAQRQELRGLAYAELERWVTEELGEKRFRAHQIAAWLHRRSARSFDEMTDLSKKLRRDSSGSLGLTTSSWTSGMWPRTARENTASRGSRAR